MFNFPSGTKVKSCWRGTSDAYRVWKVGEVHSENEEALFVIDQYGEGPFSWHKDSLIIEEIKE